ncbi:urease accessory protein UreF [Allorhizobium undicola]|uniref:urease accessory protein UreF n=1 Tax=Allorhizobium undicola TaxID=78527 RepID=UPI003D350E6C
MATPTDGGAMSSTVPHHHALLRLMAWLSPAFPVGGFAWSGGLERAVHDGLVVRAQDLHAWAQTALCHGLLWNDAVLLAQAHRSARSPAQLAAIAELAEALSGSKERHQETMGLGMAFRDAACAWPVAGLEGLPLRLAYPVAVGAVAALNGIKVGATIAAYLHAAVSQMVSAAIRLGVMGQRQGLAVLAGLENDMGRMAERAATTTLDALGSATVMADMVSARHETQATRLFRS